MREEAYVERQLRAAGLLFDGEGPNRGFTRTRILSPLIKRRLFFAHLKTLSRNTPLTVGHDASMG
jgi:hypothetical protein